MIAAIVAALLAAGGAAPAFGSAPAASQGSEVAVVHGVASLVGPSTVAAAGLTDRAVAQTAPDAEAEAGRLAFVIIPLIAAAVVVVGAIIVIARGRRGRRGD
ncbi:hypothetical protein ACIPVB_04910 [Microbacterium sp. NPDC090007]|uniref:hypothetical protein n=1 Tax=Microbacterium sp. NPDC090007 TaxID=3364204 RepID=UPI00380E0A08